MVWLILAACAPTAQTLACDANPTTLTNDPSAPVDWYVDCFLTVADTLVVEPGTTVSFGPNGGIGTSGEGRIQANGTAEEPITLEAADPGAPWHGVSVFGPAESEFTSVTFSGAGAPNTWGDGNLIVGAPAYDSGHASIRDCVFDDGDTYGLNVGLGHLSSFEGNQFTGNAVPLAVSVDAVGDLTDSTFQDNAEAYIDVLPNLLGDGTPQTWGALSLPWRIQGGVQVDSTDVIEAGAELAFAAGATLATATGPNGAGSITALGTKGSEITFRGEEDTPGSWNSVTVYVGSGHFEHAKFVGGSGASNDFEQVGMVTLDANSGGTLEIRDCVLEASTGWGIWLGSDLYNDDIEANTFVDNAAGDVRYP